MCAWCSGRSEEGIGSPGTGVPDSCEPPRGCWAFPLEEQSMFFTALPSSSPLFVAATWLLVPYTLSFVLRNLVFPKLTGLI